MAELGPVELYERASRGALAAARSIGEDQLVLPTPCSEWTVQDLLDHLVGGTTYLQGAMTGEPPQQVSGATVADLEAGIAACRAGLARDGVLEGTCLSPAGFEWTVGEATAGTAMDALVHTWDLATALDVPPDLDAEAVETVVEMFLPEMPEVGRQAGFVGPEVAVPTDAPPQDRLLGAMGRRP
jgi:uncharacterized protein (TIGR03086 family)